MLRVLLTLCLFVLVLPAAAKEPPVIVAHRGESSLAPENTLASVNLAWSLGAQAVEFDFHLTADGKPVVIHDADTKRTGDRALVIKEVPFSQLQTVDVGRWKAAKWAGERIPTLEQVLATVPEGRRMFIEVKVGPEGVPPLKQALESCGKPAARFAVISFNAATIAEVKKSLPEQQAFWITGLKQDKTTHTWSPTVDHMIATAKEIHADGLCVQGKEAVDQAFVNTVKAAGLMLNIWTIDVPEEARRYLGYGVDSVTTNRAAWMREQLQIPNQK